VSNLCMDASLKGQPFRPRHARVGQRNMTKLSKLLVVILVLVSGCNSEKDVRVRMRNDTGIQMSRVTLGSPFSNSNRLTFVALEPDAETAYAVATNFVFPCSVWSLDSTNYQRNVKLMHSPSQKTLSSGKYTAVISLGDDQPIELTLEKE